VAELEPEGERHRRHLYEGEPEEDLVAGLEPDQLEHAMERPVERRRLGVRAQAGLWLLRIFVVGVTGLVGYAFIVSVIRGV
jgi:hypothetical protein